MSLSDYFLPRQLKKTLTSHKTFVAAKPEWQYVNRLSLYSLAELAFAGNSTPVAKKEFEKLLRHLKSHWQLVRPAKTFMASAAIHKRLTQNCRACARGHHLTLANLHKVPEAHKKILTCLQSLKPIKPLPSKQPSVMAISKLLHFYNPNLFLIYDSEYIETGLLKKFAADWKAFNSFPRAPNSPFQNYLKYLYFANALIRNKSYRLKHETCAHLTKAGLPPHLKQFSTHYGVLFEFIALGALYRVSHPQKAALRCHPKR